MSYLFTEDNFNALESVRLQLDFVAALAALPIGHPQLVSTSEELYSFVAAQAETIRSVLDAATQRAEAAAKAADAHMLYFHWEHALRIANGDSTHSPRGMKEDITRRLANEAEANPDMEHVLREWLKVKEVAKILKPVPPQPAVPKARKRSKLATMPAAEAA